LKPKKEKKMTNIEKNKYKIVDTNYTSKYKKTREEKNSSIIIKKLFFNYTFKCTL